MFESEKRLATSLAILFLARGRAPVLVNKLCHGPGGTTGKKARSDWDNDLDDVPQPGRLRLPRLETPLIWQVVDARTATVAELLKAPILFFNGHYAPVLTSAQQQVLRDYVEQGGTIVADACCGMPSLTRVSRR